MLTHVQIRGRGDYSEEFRAACLARHRANVERLREARNRDRLAGLTGQGERHEIFKQISAEAGLAAARSAWTAAFGKEGK